MVVVTDTYGARLHFPSIQLGLERCSGRICRAKDEGKAEYWEHIYDALIDLRDLAETHPLDNPDYDWDEYHEPDEPEPD